MLGYHASIRPYTKKDILKQNQNDRSINMQQEHPEENHWMV